MVHKTLVTYQFPMASLLLLTCLDFDFLRDLYRWLSIRWQYMLLYDQELGINIFMYLIVELSVLGAAFTTKIHSGHSCIHCPRSIIEARVWWQGNMILLAWTFFILYYNIKNSAFVRILCFVYFLSQAFDV